MAGNARAKERCEKNDTSRVRTRPQQRLVIPHPVRRDQSSLRYKYVWPRSSEPSKPVDSACCFSNANSSLRGKTVPGQFDEQVAGVLAQLPLDDLDGPDSPGTKRVEPFDEPRSTLRSCPVRRCCGRTRPTPPSATQGLQPYGLPVVWRRTPDEMVVHADVPVRDNG